MRIAIVNDVAIAVEAIRRVLHEAREHELAWVAHDGAEAVQLCARDTPDLVLMDLIMPGMDGVEATRRIMAQSPCAILVVTASVNGSTAKVFEAMGAGALDAVNTPSFDQPGIISGATALLAKIQIINRLVGPIVEPKSHHNPSPHTANKLSNQPQLVAIGASAGGPAALAAVLAPLPLDFPAAIIAVQHVDQQFVEGLANWLGHQTKLPVRLANAGDKPQPGTVLLAGTSDHLVFNEHGKLAYTAQPSATAYRPSIDVFFHSILQSWRGDVVGVLLTGMGRDGAEGLKALNVAGHHTITQDRATSAVFGMPKAAAELKAASEILSLNRIGSRLATILNHRILSHA